MPPRILETAERVLAVAKTVVPEAGVLVSAREVRRANTRFARNEVTTSGDFAETAFTVRVALGQKHAAASSDETDEASIRRTIDRAVQMARLAPEDPEHMPLLGPQKYAEVPGAFDPRTAAASATDRVLPIRDVIAVADAAKLVVAGFYQVSAEEAAIASSAGLRASFAKTEASLTTTMRTPEGTGSGWAGAEATRAGDLDAKLLATTAAEKARRSTSPRPLAPGRYTVVLEPAAVADLMGGFVRALDAREADEGRSFFSKAGGGTKLGEKLFADNVTLVSDPTDPETPSAPFDDEGFPLSPTKWVDRGVLSSLAYSRYSAKKANAVPTGAHVTMKLTGGTAPAESDLYAGIDRGLLITRFWYVRFLDPKTMTLTGLTRDGVFLIERGEVTTPVNNFRFNESPAGVLSRLDMATQHGKRPPVQGALWRLPAIRAHEFNLASVSEAI